MLLAIRPYPQKVTAIRYIDLMTSVTRWPDYLLERAISTPPEACGVLAASTPVLAFGHPTQSTVATLGINPSSREFLNRAGQVLSNEKRRLATLESLNVAAHSELNEEHADQILNDCANYFDPVEGNPYAWFRPLNQLLQESTGTSYGASACHIDLAQWATDPVWRGLTQSQQHVLLKDGAPFLREQLRRQQFRLVLINGRTVAQAAEAAGVVRWNEVITIQGKPSADFFIGECFGSLVLGWSANIQSQPGARSLLPNITKLVRSHHGEFE